MLRLVFYTCVTAALLAVQCHGQCNPTENAEGEVATTFKTSPSGNDLQAVEGTSHCVSHEVADYEVHIISIMDADGTEARLGQQPQPGNFEIRLQKVAGSKPRPVKIVMTSVNPVHLTVHTNGVQLDDVVVTSKLVGYGNVSVSDSDSTRVWQMPGDYGYRPGWGNEEDLMWAVEDWFGFITSYTATTHASEAILNTGVSVDDAVAATVGDTIFSRKTCQDTISHPFSRGLFTSRRKSDAFGCYSSRLSGNRELYVLSVQTAESAFGSRAFGTGTIDLHVKRFANEVLHPVSLFLTSGSPVEWNIDVADGITIFNVTVACPELDVEDCSANIVDSAGNALDVPVNFVEEGLSYERAMDRPSVDYALRNFGFVTSFAGTYQARSAVVRVGVNTTHDDTSDYELVFAQTTLSPELPAVTTTETKVTTEEYYTYDESYYAEMEDEDDVIEDKQAKDSKKPNIKSEKGPQYGSASGSSTRLYAQFSLLLVLFYCIF